MTTLPTTPGGATVAGATLTDASPIDDVLRALPQAELDELAALGDTRDDVRWKIGDKARQWIDDKRMPAMQICKIIGHKTDYSYERVRHFLYVSRYYHTRQDLRSTYLVVRYSIFEHAMGCADPEAVLKAAHDGQLSPTAVKLTSPAIMDDLRETYNRVPRKNEAAARSIVEIALAKLRELMD